ncbi:MAG: alpha-ketoglutarate-dependent dioxygenase AlkB [Rhodobacter sp.]|nr:alpha-ketoglutarate-dependent dioxygenase AlkB [Rhodobacter sp.]MCY4169350.1 alpha-ketoglutarate-dependent dioxygenase AlkB [Rhodobacter sp.]
MPEPTFWVRGVPVFRGLLDGSAQASMVEDLRGVVAAAPLISPLTPRGKPMSVKMTSAGKYGWYSDRAGYRYERRHPAGVSWPAIPQSVLAVWNSVTGLRRRPDCCLLNFYGTGARMGMHQDRDEADFSYPVVSVSLGDDALFRVGNRTRGGRTESVWLSSGDVVVMGGAARLLHHGVDRIRNGTSALLGDGGRINLTLRVVD